MSFKTWRKGRKLNQAKAAEMLGFTQSTLSRIEADESAASLSVALLILDMSGECIGPLARATAKEIATLRKFHSEGAAA